MEASNLPPLTESHKAALADPEAMTRIFPEMNPDETQALADMACSLPEKVTTPFHQAAVSFVHQMVLRIDNYTYLAARQHRSDHDSRLFATKLNLDEIGQEVPALIAYEENGGGPIVQTITVIINGCHFDWTKAFDDVARYYLSQDIAEELSIQKAERNQEAA